MGKLALSTVRPSATLKNGVSFDPAKDGSIPWIDGDIIGFQCGCGCDEILVLGFDEDDPTECDDCGARLYFVMQIEVKSV